MIKFAKWMYELGYNRGIAQSLSILDRMTPEKPREEDIKNSTTTRNFSSKIDHAWANYYATQKTLDMIREKLDPNFKVPFGEQALEKLMKEL
jgi:hypothetical protein